MLITIDTNVLYQALRSSSGASFLIMKLVRSGSCRIALSQPVFAEYQDVLTRKSSLAAFELTHSDVEKILRYISHVGQKFDPYFLFRPNLKDENDKISEYRQGYDKKEIFRGFDDVMSKVKKRKVPQWDKA